jgi:hypothetical protein
MKRYGWVKMDLWMGVDRKAWMDKDKEVWMGKDEEVWMGKDEKVWMGKDEEVWKDRDVKVWMDREVKGLVGRDGKVWVEMEAVMWIEKRKFRKERAWNVSTYERSRGACEAADAPIAWAKLARGVREVPPGAPAPPATAVMGMPKAQLDDPPRTTRPSKCLILFSPSNSSNKSPT